MKRKYKTERKDRKKKSKYSNLLFGQCVLNMNKWTHTAGEKREIKIYDYFFVLFVYSM